MKFCVLVSAFFVIFCVCESDSFKILKKLKNLIHPTESTVSTTTIVPRIPEFEKQGHNEDDSNSWELESSTTAKSKNSEEDLSTSQSAENQGGTYSNSKNKYNSGNPDRTKPYPGALFQSSAQTTESNNFNSGYGNNQENNNPSSYGSSNNREITSTSTDAYGQSNNKGNYPGPSSYLDSFGNEEVRSTTTESYDFVSQSRPDQKEVDGIQTQTISENNYGGSYGSKPDQPSSGVGVVPDDLPPTTPKDFYSGYSGTIDQSTTTESYDSQGQPYDGQSSVFGNHGGESQSTTSRSYYNNIPDQSSLFGSNSDNNIPSTSTSKYNQDQNYDDQSSVSGNANNEKQESTTPISDYGNNNLGTPDQTSYSENTQTTSNNKTSYGQIPTYNNFNSVVSTTTTGIDVTESEPGQSSGSNYNGATFDTTSSTTPNSAIGSSGYGGNQNKKTPVSRPSYSSTKDSNQAKDQGNKNFDPDIIFPDHPSLNPTPETERIFGENDPYFKRIKGQQNKTHVPVGEEEERRILDVEKTCAPGETLDTRRNICRKLARK